MKYIGATDAFVRAPFLLEGMVLGVVGAAVPLIVLYFCYNGAISYILTRNMEIISSNTMMAMEI